jgi:hypothetical protein
MTGTIAYRNTMSAGRQIGHRNLRVIGRSSAVLITAGMFFMNLLGIWRLRCLGRMIGILRMLA